MTTYNKIPDTLGNLVMLGISHKTAEVETRELFSFSSGQVSGLYDRLFESGIDESIYVSTCNRVEFYLTAEDMESAAETVKKILQRFTKLSQEKFEESVYVRYGSDVVRHLLSVASSLDSMVVGENEITGQIKNSFREATEYDATGPILNRLFHKAFSTSKRVRTETEISKNPLSMASIAVDRAKMIFPEISGKKILLIGAGEMGELILKYMIKEDPGRIILANRTVEKAEKICSELDYDADIIPLSNLDKALKKSDIVITSVTAPHHVISASDLQDLMIERDGKPIFLIDIAVPRNIEPGAEDLDNVYLYNVDSLKEIADMNMQSRYSEIDKAKDIIEEEVQEFKCWHDDLCIAPTITALNKKFDEIRKNVFEKYSLKKLKHLSEDDLEIINELTMQIMKKTLHNPIINLKKTSSSSWKPGEESIIQSAKFVEDLFTKC